jgi:Zn-dependent protease
MGMVTQRFPLLQSVVHGNVYILGCTRDIRLSEGRWHVNYLVAHWLFSLIGTLLLGLSAMVLHEFGHLVTSLMVGIKVKSIGLCMKGMYIVREAGSPTKNILISLAGPLTNVALLLLFWHVSTTFTLANLCLAICNLAPVKGSDGDRVLVCLEQLQRESTPTTQAR